MFDCVIVGGGPAGSTSACILRENGLNILLIDKHNFPRKKTCAGSISCKAFPHLPLGWEKTIERKIKGAIVEYKEKRVIGYTKDIIAVTVNREKFDGFLLEKAKERGVVFKNETLIDFHNEDPIYVKTNNNNYNCKFLILADGAATVARRWKRNIEYLKAWQAPCTTTLPLIKELVISIGIAKHGYGWIFPQKKQALVGIATKGENAFTLFKKYINENKLIYQLTDKPSFWLVPYPKNKDIVYGMGNCLFVGDALGLTNPLSGEGIYYALHSGEKAAHSILEEKNIIKAYKNKLAETMDEFLWCRRLADVITHAQHFSFHSLKKKHSLQSPLNFIKGNNSCKGIFLRLIKKMLLFNI
ncbi:MAG: geranylgeranyl reductase family protein [Deltaproteobacteria bacterium]|nr:geranylgeranyl reductase family protein [Deltaproteobacteria bacterium]